MTTDMLIAILKEHPGVHVRMREIDFRLVEVQSAEYVETAYESYIWIRTD